MQDPVDCLVNYRQNVICVPMGAWRKALGDLGEICVCSYLQSRGWNIEARGFRRFRSPEIDVVALDPQGVLVFIEVKTRAFANGGLDEFDVGLQSVDRRKQAKLIKAARTYYSESSSASYAGRRFDVLALSIGKYQVFVQDEEEFLEVKPSDVRLLHIEDAFRPGF